MNCWNAEAAACWSSVPVIGATMFLMTPVMNPPKIVSRSHSPRPISALVAAPRLPQQEKSEVREQQRARPPLVDAPGERPVQRQQQ